MEAAGVTLPQRCMQGVRLSLMSTRPLPSGWPGAGLGRGCVLLQKARGLQDSGVLGKPGVSLCPLAFPCPPVPPRCPCGQQVRACGQTHTTALFTSTPLLLWEELMGYSAMLVPFSSFLSGFLFMAL